MTRHEREQRRAAAAARGPVVPGLLPQAAADGKTARGAVRPDGSQVHLLSAFHVTEGRTMAQREVDAKTNEIPELGPMLEELDLQGMVITADALHGQRETARMITEDLGAHYLLFIKANQPSLLNAIMTRLNGTDSEFAATTWTQEVFHPPISRVVPPAHAARSEVCRCWGASSCWSPVPARDRRRGVSRSRRPYLVVSAHSWRILFTQTFGGMSSMPTWSALFEICRWSASSAWSLKSRSRRA